MESLLSSEAAMVKAHFDLKCQKINLRQYQAIQKEMIREVRLIHKQSYGFAMQMEVSHVHAAASCA